MLDEYMDGFRDKLRAGGLNPVILQEHHSQKVLRQGKENNLLELHTLIAFVRSDICN